MERAGKSLSKMRVKAIEVAGIRMYHLAPGAWAAAVGKKIASHTRPTFLEDGKLTVEVSDAIWQAQLSTLREPILLRLEKVIGRDVIHSIEFRIAPARRGPQIAAPVAAEKDEADGIQDPIMRRLYRSARRKASA
jgi:predicted nucleic acid-binding Zn ribbon protein